jgi:predicted ATP-grasp superfamily ATP-dependent carboligase
MCETMPQISDNITAGAHRASAIVVDGSQNALSVARSLVRLGLNVYTLSERGEPVRFSQGVQRIEAGGETAVSWERFLLGTDSDYLSGSLLLACSDPAIELLARNSEKLSQKFVLEEGDPATRILLLDKLRTYQEAKKAGIPAVDYQFVETLEQLQNVGERFRFPVILKPLHSADSERFGGKIVIANDKAELLSLWPLLERGVKAVAMEFIPGGDDRLCSYYAYMDERGDPLVEFTKRVLRRSPIHTGSVSYHITDWNPEAADIGRRFFRYMKLKGIGNIEFKRDPRDGELKIIEVNARFTLGDPLLVSSGVDLTAFTVARLTGQPPPPRVEYKRGLVLWIPPEDMRTFLQLRARKEITWREWLGQVARARVFPYFSLRDPIPSLYQNTMRALQVMKLLALHMCGRLRRQHVRAGAILSKADKRRAE